ncbi:MAG: MBOAT family protein [Pseudolabrys sp.]|nr:MBOAT family protein [Pseudolabrys sp.]
MLFPTPEFAFFFFAVFVAAWALRAHAEPRKLVLLGASYFFYGFWDWRFMALLAGSSLFNWAAGLLVAASNNETARHRLVALATAVNLGLLGYFKYYNFFMDSLTDLTVALGIQRDMPFLEIILPIGISFFTFQGISYVIDVYRRQLKPVASPIDLALYISFFPQLVAGPIVRASHFLPQLGKVPVLTRAAISTGFLLILNGMLKKTVIAHYLAVDLIDPVFDNPSQASSTDLLAAHYAYVVQVYCDFSAYSDIAIGAAALLGYRFRKNFDRPFGTTSLQQLWQRWHISLSTWLRDYVYRPLRGDKRDAGWRMYRNVFLTMLIGGLWHGANWTFVIWGAIHGAALVVERTVKTRWHDWQTTRLQLAPAGAAVTTGRLTPTPLAAFVPAFTGWFITFHLFTLAAIFFRSPDVGIATDYFRAMFAFRGGAELLTPFVAALTVGSIAMHFTSGDGLERLAQRIKDWPATALGLLFGFGLLFIAMIGPEGVAPFIYFQF